MNERIREIIEQAHLVADATYARGPDSIWERKYNKKLVELIVKETITEMSQQLYWHGEDQSNNPAFYKAIDKTKKHFGVKE